MADTPDTPRVKRPGAYQTNAALLALVARLDSEAIQAAIREARLEARLEAATKEAAQRDAALDQADAKVRDLATTVQNLSGELVNARMTLAAIPRWVRWLWGVRERDD